jgi:hypothetical protein
VALRRGLCSEDLGSRSLQKLWRMRKELGMVTVDMRRKMGIVKTRGRNGEQGPVKLIKL